MHNIYGKQFKLLKFLAVIHACIILHCNDNNILISPRIAVLRVFNHDCRVLCMLIFNFIYFSLPELSARVGC